MPEGKFVAYYRVSTAKQGTSGLGLEAQQSAVMSYLNGGQWTLLGAFTEVESGKNNERPELAKAMQRCRQTGATLIISKLDRLSRDAHFLLGLAKAGVDFVAVDMPNANRLTVGIMAVVAEEERRMISARTKAALGAAKARGQTLGGWRGGPMVNHSKGTEARQRAADAFAASVGPLVTELTEAGQSLRQTASELTLRGVRTPRGGAWSAAAVRAVSERFTGKK